MEHDPRRFEQRLAPRHDFLLQLEIGDAIDEQAADSVVAVIDRDTIALAAELLPCGKAGGPGADDTDGAVELAQRLRRLDPARGEGGLGQVFLYRADRHRREILLEDAIALAEPVLRTDPAADLGEVV